MMLSAQRKGLPRATVDVTSNSFLRSKFTFQAHASVLPLFAEALCQSLNRETATPQFRAIMD